MKSSQSSSTRKAVQIVVAAGVALGSASAAAAEQIFLQIEGVPGESQDKAHKDWIDIQAFSSGTGPKQCPQFNFQKRIDKATPKLMEGAFIQRRLGKSTLSLMRTGEVPYEAMKIVFEGTIAEYQSMNSCDYCDSGYESFSILMSSAAVSYKPQLPDGSLGAEVKATLNCATLGVK